MKITAFNIERMNDLFYPDEPRLKTSHKKGAYTGPAIKDVPALCSRIQGTIREIDPDILGVVEGPKRPSQMEKFVQEYLRGQSGSPIYDVVANPSERAQRPYLPVKHSTATAVRTLHDEPRYEKMIERWKFYPWGAYMPKTLNRTHSTENPWSPSYTFRAANSPSYWSTSNQNTLA